MKRLEKRERMITYCDYCKKEITAHTHAIIRYKGKEEMDFCSVHTAMIDKTCLDKHNESELEKYKDSKKLTPNQ